MMSEHEVIIRRAVNVQVTIGWTELHACAKILLDQTKPTDVRFVHVQRAKDIYDAMQALFDQHKSNTRLEGQAPR